MTAAATFRAMRQVPQAEWPQANLAFLNAEFAYLCARLEGGAPARTEELREVTREAGMEPPAAIDQLTAIFGLTDFERDLLLLCAGVEMDSAIADRCAHAQGAAQRTAPTFGLALAALDKPHWSALAPAGPLRRYRLIEIDASHGLTSAPLRIDERILHFLAGINQLDPRLAMILTPVQPAAEIAQEHRAIAARIAAHFAPSAAPASLVHLYGDDSGGQRDTAALAAAQASMQLFTLRAEEIPADAAALEQILLLVSREAVLLQAALIVDCGAAPLSLASRTFIERLSGPIAVSSRDPFHTARTSVRYEVNKPRPAEQKRLWQLALGPAASPLNGFIDNLAAQFRMSAKAIHDTGSMYAASGSALDADALWSSCRAAAQPRLEELAARIPPAAAWDDLILPESQLSTLRQIASQARHRMKVYETWGFAAKNRRGLGVSALFSGESGTGKTLAAEVLASALGLDLYRIDLSAVVSKYIGETEKNLRLVFDAAEEAGAVLLFDEADALFGKRSDVKDSHDRYANIEVGYLLQRMEAYQGLAILTTNLKSALDRAFQRRLRFIVEFPFPDAAQREAIWRRVFPRDTPTEGIKTSALAQLKLPGGGIRNIVLNAAFLAAEVNSPVTMMHILEAARLEALKNDRPLSEAETRGWV